MRSLFGSLTALFLAACSGRDATFIPADAGPLLFQPVCVNGWCFDEPVPMNGVQVVVGAPNDNWWVSPQWLVHFVDGVPTPTPRAETENLFTGAADLWLAGRDGARHLEGGVLRDVPLPAQFGAASVAGNGSLFGRGLDRSFGVVDPSGTFHAIEAPPLAEGDVLDFAAFDEHDVWAQTFISFPDAGFRSSVLHFDGAAWTTLPNPDVASAEFSLLHLDAVQPGELWVGLLPGVLLRWNGSTWTRFEGVSSVVKVAGGELWAPKGTSYALFDGSTFVAVPPPPVSFANWSPVGHHWLWGVTGNHDVYFFDGATWRQLTRRLSTATNVGLAVTPADAGNVPFVLSVEPDRAWVATRSEAGAWQRGALPAARGDRFVGVTANRRDDVWAFGTGPVHFDGQAWTRTTFEGVTSEPSFTSLCVGSLSTAFAVAPQVGLFVWNGSVWKPEFRGDSPTGNAYYGIVCDAFHGGVWAIGQTMAERRAGHWVIHAPPAQLVGVVARDAVVTAFEGTVSWFHGGVWQRLEQRASSVTGTSSSDLTLLDESGSLWHFNGSTFDSQRPITQPLVAIHALAPGELLGIEANLRTWRFSANTVTQVAPSHLTPYAISRYASVSFVSATLGFAVSVNNELLRFDGTDWRIEATGSPSVSSVLALAADDVWAATSDGLRHFTGSTWALVSLPGQTNERVLALSGSRTAGVWALSAGAVWRQQGSGFERLPVPTRDAPREWSTVLAAGPNDVWLTGQLNKCGSIGPQLYRWNGTSVTRWDAPSGVHTVGYVGDALYAAGGLADCSQPNVTYRPVVWENVGGAWLERPQLVAATLFPRLSLGPLPEANLGVGGAAPAWGVSPSSIFRQQ